MSPLVFADFSSSVRQRICLALLTVLTTSSVFATDLSTQKLFGRWDRSPVSYYLGFGGSNAALSPKWIVVGAPEALERDSTPEGAVQVFNAATGAWVRKLLPPGTPTAYQAFGGAVAICGDLAGC